jgi:hypothetical protein
LDNEALELVALKEVDAIQLVGDTPLLPSAIACAPKPCTLPPRRAQKEFCIWMKLRLKKSGRRKSGTLPSEEIAWGHCE